MGVKPMLKHGRLDRGVRAGRDSSYVMLGDFNGEILCLASFKTTGQSVRGYVTVGATRLVVYCMCPLFSATGLTR